MNRRQFLGSLVALAATAVLPKESIHPGGVIYCDNPQDVAGKTYYPEMQKYVRELGRVLRETKDSEIREIFEGRRP